jgi:hypothetical protein
MALTYKIHKTLIARLSAGRSGQAYATRRAVCHSAIALLIKKIQNVKFSHPHFSSVKRALK